MKSYDDHEIDQNGSSNNFGTSLHKTRNKKKPKLRNQS